MGGDKLFEQVFNLKFMAKQLAKSAVKSEKEEKAEKLKIKKAMEKGNMEGARIYSQNAIRKKQESLNYMKLASQLDAVVGRLETQAKMQMVSKNMSSIVKTLDMTLKSGNLEKIQETMNKFERQFEDLDLQTHVMDGVMSNQAQLTTPQDEVNSLMAQVAEEHGLEVGLNMPNASAAQPSGTATEQDSLAQRMAALKGQQ